MLNLRHKSRYRSLLATLHFLHILRCVWRWECWLKPCRETCEDIFIGLWYIFLTNLLMHNVPVWLFLLFHVSLKGKSVGACDRMYETASTKFFFHNTYYFTKFHLCDKEGWKSNWNELWIEKIFGCDSCLILLWITILQHCIMSVQINQKCVFVMFLVFDSKHNSPWIVVGEDTLPFVSLFL